MAFDTFEIVGKLRAINSEKIKGLDVKLSDSGWILSTLKFSVMSGTNNIIVQIKSNVKGSKTADGKFKPDANQEIFSRSKGDKDSKGENIRIPFGERKNKKWLDTVAAFKKLVIDKETTEDRKKLYAIRKAIADGSSLTDEQYKFLGVNTVDAANEAVESRARNEYLSEYDFVNAVNKFIGEVDKDDMFKVSGSVDITYDPNTKTPYKNYTVTKIERVSNDTEPKAYVTMDVFFNKDSLDVTDWVEVKEDGKKIPKVSGKAILNGKQRFYCKDKRYNIEGTFATDVIFEIPGTTKNWSMKNRFAKKFESGVNWKSVRLNLNIIDGAEIVELTEDMLTEDQLLDIECGATTLEEIKADMSGNIYGERVRKYTFRELTNSKNDVEDTAFEDSDMVLPYSAESEELESDDTNVFEDDDDDI